MKKNLFTLLLASVLLAAGTARAAEADIISGASICTEYDKNGNVNTGGFSGGDGMSNLFDKNFDAGVHFGRSGDGSYFLLDFTGLLSGGYYITEIRIGEQGGKKYSVYWSPDGTTWNGVDNAVGVIKVGTGIYGVNEVATHVKVVMDESAGWGVGLSEIQVWGIDPAEVSCRHPSFTDWEEVSGSATCTKYGIERRKCTVCGEVFERESALPLGHDWETHLATPGTSSSYGSGSLTCLRCGESIAFNVPVDLTTEGGVAAEGRIQFADLSVSSTSSDSGGVGPKQLIDNKWTWDWAAYWFAATRSENEYVQWDFAAEIDLTKLEWSAPNHALTLKFYLWDGETEEPLVEIPVTKDNTNNGYQRGSMEFRGVVAKGIRLHIADPTGIGYNGISPVGLSELHPWGTVIGAGKLNVLRTKILLY